MSSLLSVTFNLVKPELWSKTAPSNANREFSKSEAVHIIEFTDTSRLTYQYFLFAIAPKSGDIVGMLIDMHIHTKLSPCSDMTIDDILDRAKARGLDGVCITDHDTMDIRHQLSEGVQPNGICVLFGMEYSTHRGDFLLFGSFETLPTGLPAKVLLRTVQEAGGVAVAAHPFRRQRPVDEQVIQERLCHAVESLNGRNSFAENAAVSDWLRRYDIVQCGGSDAHIPEEVGTFGTRFFNPILSRVDLIRALKYKKCHPEALSFEAAPMDVYEATANFR